MVTLYSFANIANAIALFKDATENFRLTDAFDLLIVVFLVYAALILLKRMKSVFLFSGIFTLLLLYFISRSFNLYLTNTILQTFLPFAAIIVVVIFQKEFRSFFEWLSVWGRLSHFKKEKISELVSGHIVRAVEYLAKNHIGALIVLPADQPIDTFTEGGVLLNGRVSHPLILSLFDPSSPGHDGAIIIEGDRIKRFGVHLPLAEKFQKYGNIGTRHRAALGISEVSDAMTIIVSEERGTITLATGGELKTMKNADELRSVLSRFLREKFFHNEDRPWHHPITNNLKEKLQAVLITFTLWAIFVVYLGANTITKQFDIPIEFRFLPDNYTISELSPNEIHTTLSGRAQNFNLLSPDSLRVIVDVTSTTADQQRIKITENLITAPPALSIVDISPTIIKFRLEKK